MDIARMSVLLNLVEVRQAASLSVMKMAMDNAKQNGKAMTQMLQNSTPEMEVVSLPHLGNRIDVRG